MMEPDLAGAPRADFCRLLAACYYEPDPAFEQERLFESLSTAAAALGPDFADDARALGAAFAEERDALLVDYTRLFIGPGDMLASPYEASWRGRDGASPVLPVLALYEEGGFEVAEDFLDLPDHVAVQLEFLYLLIFRGTEAVAAGDLDGIARWEALERRFLAAHLARWVDPFASAMHAGTTCRFYAALATATRRFVAAEEARLGVR